MDNNSFAETIVTELLAFIRPIQAAALDPSYLDQLLYSAGWTPSVIGSNSILKLIQAFSEIATLVSEIERWTNQPPQSLEDLQSVLQSSARIFDVIQGLSGGLIDEDAHEMATLAQDLLEQLTVYYLKLRLPVLLELLGVLTLAPIEKGVVQLRNGIVTRTDSPRQKLRLDRLPNLLQQPTEVLKAFYMPSGLKTRADANAAAERIAIPFVRLMDAVCLYANSNSPVQIRASFGLDEILDFALVPAEEQERLKGMLTLAAHFRQAMDGAAIAVGATLGLMPEDDGGPGIMIVPFGALSLSEVFSELRFWLSLEGALNGFEITKNGLSVYPGESGEFALSASVVSERKADQPYKFGASDLFLQVGKYGTYLQLENSGNNVNLVIETSIYDSALVLLPPSGDGFLQQILPKDGLRVDFHFSLGWSSSKGLYIKGGAGLEATLPINKDLFGVLLIESIYLSLLAKDSHIDIAAASSVTIKLGPITAFVQQMGLKTIFSFPEKGGNLGPINLEMGFKPPKGVGLAIDATAVVGVGYLDFDFDNQTYSGFVYLEIAESFSVTAVGLITTKMPDGSPGFSMLILIAVQFSPALQLGYGFTLNGLGGLLGINRTAAVDVLRQGLRNGTLGSILFPDDPVHNAAKIVSDLGAVFPPAQGRFVFGPMAILGWGPKTLIMLELGLVLELPEPVRLLILGRLKVILPEEKKPVIRLQLDSLGVIDFGSGDISLDAILYDSEIKGFTITGEMALRANLGAKPDFLLSVGGFHPAYQPPVGFTALNRVAISLATGDNPRLRLAAYMALTTNTVQFGALLELFVKFGEFSVEGQLGFDALIQFEPFGIIAGLGAMVAVKSGGVVLLAVGLDMTLTGPTPWHAWGKASFKLLGFVVKVEFSVQSGEPQPPPLPAPVKIRPLIVAALKENCNWGTQLPVGEHPIVVLKGQAPGNEMLVHPMAKLQVSQKVVPLEFDLSRFGNVSPEGEHNFKLGVRGAAVAETVYDMFAPAQFREMSDDEKLSAPAFESHKSGMRFTVGGYECGGAVIESNMQYEEPSALFGKSANNVSPNSAPALLDATESYTLSTAVLAQVASSGAAGLTLLNQTGKAKYRTPTVEGESASGFRVKPRRYVVVGKDGSIDNYESFAVASSDALQKLNAVDFAGNARMLRIVPYLGEVA